MAKKRGPRAVEIVEDKKVAEYTVKSLSQKLKQTEGDIMLEDYRRTTNGELTICMTFSKEAFNRWQIMASHSYKGDKTAKFRELLNSILKELKTEEEGAFFNVKTDWEKAIIKQFPDIELEDLGKPDVHELLKEFIVSKYKRRDMCNPRVKKEEKQGENKSNETKVDSKEQIVNNVISNLQTQARVKLTKSVPEIIKEIETEVEISTIAEFCDSKNKIKILKVILDNTESF